MIAVENKTSLRIADFVISLENHASDGTRLLLEEGYTDFVSFSGGQKADVEIIAFQGIPETLPHETTLLYRAARGDQEFWSVYRDVDGYRLLVYDQSAPFALRQLAVIDSCFNRWQIHSVPFTENESVEGICPLAYPMGPLLLYYLTVPHEAIMIHASGISENETGRIFSGFSGVGKSTMAKLWADKGHLTINDDRLIIRKKNGAFYIYNTPMHYRDYPKTSPLHSVFLPYHAPKNTIAPVPLTKAISKLLGYSIIHGYDKNHLEQHLSFLVDMCTQLPVFSLGVVPTPAIIEFIKHHEVNHSSTQP